MATKSYRCNFIATLSSSTDNIVCDHEDKAALLWLSYKDRIGITDNCPMLFNLAQLIPTQNSLELASIETPFTNKEIDDIISSMPTNKSPGPDGSNGAFMKKCWPIIKEHFYKLCHDFYNGDLNMSSINTAFITLIPKCQDPLSVNDYRPISLVSITLKILTKILANRL